MAASWLKGAPWLMLIGLNMFVTFARCGYLKDRA
jgi:uncharacterized protein (DUF486 family)